MSGRLSVQSRISPCLAGSPIFSPYVAWNRNAALEHFFEFFAVRCLVQGALSRTDQLHTMTAPLESFDETPQGHGNAVDLGRVGLRNHCHPERWRRDR